MQEIIWVIIDTLDANRELVIKHSLDAAELYLEQHQWAYILGDAPWVDD